MYTCCIPVILIVPEDEPEVHGLPGQLSETLPLCIKPEKGVGMQVSVRVLD